MFIYVKQLFFWISILLTGIIVLILTVIPNEWWIYIVSEDSPMAWFESLILFSCSITLIYCLILSLKDYDKRKTYVLIFLSLVFAYLTLDEKFAIHEKIRDTLLAPRDIKLVFFWVAPGDFILLVFMIFGIAITPYIVKTLKESKTSIILFIFAVVFSGCSVIMDSFDFNSMDIFIQRVQQYSEEIVEITAMLFFLNSFFSLFMDYINKVLSNN